MAKARKIVAKAHRSGVDKILGRAGRKSSGKSVSKPKARARILESRSGRRIIASPVTSANTVNSWSSAFRHS
jgi:hypothetical protein